MALSDILTPRIVELGNIRIGTLGEKRRSKSGGEYRVPKKLDRFLVTSRHRDEEGILVPDYAVMEALKEYADSDGGVRRIPIALLSDNIEDSLRASYVMYAGKKCLARSDGVNMTKFGDPKTGEMLAEPETKPWKSEYLDLVDKRGVPLFKQHIVLDAVIAIPQARWGGVYRFRSTSVITGDQLYGSLTHLQGLTGGVLIGMPLMLVVRPVQVAPKGVVTTVYCVHVELFGENLLALQNRALEFAKFQKEHRTQLITVRRELRDLPDPGLGEDEDTQADIQEEFHPEEHEDDPLERTAKVLEAKFSGLDVTKEDRELICQHVAELSYEDVLHQEGAMTDVLRWINGVESGDEPLAAVLDRIEGSNEPDDEIYNPEEHGDG